MRTPRAAVHRGLLCVCRARPRQARPPSTAPPGGRGGGGGGGGEEGVARHTTRAETRLPGVLPPPTSGLGRGREPRRQGLPHPRPQSPPTPHPLATRAHTHPHSHPHQATARARYSELRAVLHGGVLGRGGAPAGVRRTCRTVCAPLCTSRGESRRGCGLSLDAACKVASSLYPFVRRAAVACFIFSMMCPHTPHS